MVIGKLLNHVKKIKKKIDKIGTETDIVRVTVQYNDDKCHRTLANSCKSDNSSDSEHKELLAKLKSLLRKSEIKMLIFYFILIEIKNLNIFN